MSPARTRTPVLLAVLGLMLALLATPAGAQTDVQPARVAGPTRLETAASVARLSFPDGADEAVLATSVDFREALVGSALAGAVNAPILLTPPDFLAETTSQALADLGVQAVTILGDEGDVSGAVAQELDENYAVARIAGDDDYDTAARIARQAVDLTGALPTIDGRSTVLLASGEDFPDALAASGPAFDAVFPLLLTRPDELPGPVSDALADFDPDQALLIGGPEAISNEVADELESRGILTTRLGGRNRVETATIVADFFIRTGFFDQTHALLARGDAFPDAVTVGSLSGQREAPILLTAQPDLLTEIASAWFRDACGELEVLQVVGGTAAVTVEVANGAEAAAESCSDPDPDRGQTFAVDPQEPLTRDPGDSADLRVARRYDGQPFAGPVDLVLFPCASADVTGPGTDVFADTDRDGAADGFGTTDTGQARIAVVDGTDIADDTVVVGAQPDEDGVLDIRLASEQEDCTILIVVAGDDDGELDLDTNNHPVEAYGVGKVRWHSDQTDGGGQAFAVAPMEPRTAEPGTPIDFSVIRRYDGQAFAGPVDLVLFPCATTDVVGDNPDTFGDVDDDRAADAFGSTDDGQARIAVVNGRDIPDQTVVGNVSPDDDGVLTFRLSSGGTDCTVPVVVDGDGDGEFDVDADGHPTEPYGVGRASWQT